LSNSSIDAQTKWVSEKLCQVALARGLPVAVVRPGYIVGNGVTQTDDFLWRLLRGCLTLGSAPLMRNRLNACSVEYVSSLAIAALKTETCKVFHTVNPELFTFDDLFQAAATYGWKLQRIEYLAWRDALQSRTLLSQDHDLYPLLHFVLDDLPTKSLAPRLDNRNAARITTSVCASMQSMLPNIFSFLVASGFLGSPTEPGAVPLPPFAHTAVLMAARRK
jgi:L-aminoadipate-semialdehyde dehydrogenase